MQHTGVEFAATDRKYETNDQRAMVSFNIASAYPKEAGIKGWIRTVTLDRARNTVIILEEIRLGAGAAGEPLHHDAAHSSH